MLRSKNFENKYCVVSKQPQHVTVYFQLANPGNLNDFKRVKFDCDNSACKLLGTTDCCIFKAAIP